MMKFLAALLSFVMVLSLTSCGERDLNRGTNPETNKKQETSQIPDEKEEKKEEEVIKPEISEALNEGQKEALENEEEKKEEEKEEKEPLPFQIDREYLETLEHEQIPWGFGPHFNEDKRSQSCEYLMGKYADKGAIFIMPKEDKVYLTFDEGYENGFTPQILDTLKEKDVKATFFITGDYFRTQKELIQRMIDEGHTVGSHSNKHIDFAKKTVDEGYEDLKWLHDGMREEFGYEMRHFRFPGGSFSERSLEMVNEIGYKSVFWSFGYRDWDPKNQMEPSEALSKLTDAVHPGEVLLLHPVGGTNCEILGELIDNIKDMGYELETIPD